jgi:uncharacterized RmlC-like cupin family protein
MDRQQAIATDGSWASFVRTEVGMVSGWLHHGEYETVIYVLSGALKMEFGPNGSNTVQAGPGDFVFVPKGAVHRESNPSTVPADVIVVRAGSGESTVTSAGHPHPDGRARSRHDRAFSVQGVMHIHACWADSQVDSSEADHSEEGCTYLHARFMARSLGRALEHGALAVES